MQFRLLGPIEALRDGEPLPIRRPKQRALLAALVLRAGEVVPVDRLIDQLWGDDPPPRAVGSLQNLVSQLRGILGGELILTRPPGYLMDVPRELVDVWEFERLVSAGRLREALALWRGPALADLAGEPLAAIEAPLLEERRLTVEESLLEQRLAAGEGAELVPELERLVAEHPLREGPRRQLMLALYRAGRQAEALDAYRAARDTLVEARGIDPSRELQELFTAILNQDASLSVQQVTRDTEEHRKTVTLVAVDLGDAPPEEPEALRIVVRRLAEGVEEAVARHGGRVERRREPVLASFGAVRVAENDPLRAAEAALEVAASTGGRVGVATGDVLVGPDGVVGAPVGVADRLARAAFPGEVLAAPSTLALLGAAVEVEPVGQVGAIGPGRVVSLEPGTTMPLRTHDAPLVDRLDELRVLRDAFAAAADRGGVLTMVADAGVGKTRLASELSLALADLPTATHVGRCAPYGDGPSWLPLAEALRPAVGDADAAAGLIEDADAADSVRRAVGAVLGESAGAMPAGEMHWALARLLEALARDRPRLVVLEDVHWAADTLLDFVEYLRARPPRGHVLVLALARPDLWTRRPGWADERSVRLEPLPEDDSRVLLARLGMDDPRLTRELVGVAGGNPFFLQQLLAHVSERGQVTGLPGTIDAVMAARLDALAPEERRVVERAAVAGRDFSRRAVAELAEDEGTDRALLALLRRGLLQVSRDGSAPDMLRFSHALLHEAAYGSIPRDRRAAMHERLAAFEAAAPEAHDEVVGSHLERAHRDWAAVDASHPGLDALAERGGRRLGVAGIRAWQRSDAASAASLLDRATRLLPAGHPERPALYPELAMARELAGDRDGALAALAEAAATSADVGDEATAARARIELAQLRFVAGRASAEDVLDATAAAIPVLTSAGDDRALGRAWLLRGLALGGARCDNAAWAEAAGTALEHYRRAGWPVGAVVSGIAAASYHGPTPAAETIARCDGLLEDASAGRLARSYVALYRAGARAMTGAFDDARQEADDARAVAEELEAATFGRDYGQVRGAIEVLAGDPVAAESVYRTTLAALVERGETAYAAHRAAELAGVLYDLGRFEEAAAHVRRSRSLAIDDDLPTRFLRASVEAKLAARDGDLGAALELAREAAALAGATDALNQRAQVGLDLATVLRAAGREGEATAAEAEALRLLEAKGNVAALVRIGAGDTPRT